MALLDIVGEFPEVFEHREQLKKLKRPELEKLRAVTLGKKRLFRSRTPQVDQSECDHLIKLFNPSANKNSYQQIKTRKHTTTENVEGKQESEDSYTEESNEQKSEDDKQQQENTFTTKEDKKTFGESTLKSDSNFSVEEESESMTINNTISKASMKPDDPDQKKHRRKRMKHQMQLNIKSVMSTIMLKRTIMNKA